MVTVAACSPGVISGQQITSVTRSTHEVSIQRGGVELHGTLELPEAGGPVPAVLLIQGSAAFDRSNLGLLDTLAHRLAGIGFASLRVDDRGTGSSGGVKHDLRAHDLAEGSKALHAYLASRHEVDGGRVGILGSLAFMAGGKHFETRVIRGLAGFLEGLDVR
jgi:predicted acyl esterase